MPELEALLTPRQPRRQGQGVLEYAGALVVATLIISAALLIVPPGFAGLPNELIHQIGRSIIAYLS